MKTCFFISDPFMYQELPRKFCKKVYCRDLTKAFENEISTNGFGDILDLTREKITEMWDDDKCVTF